jgi:hypothetical protein
LVLYLGADGLEHFVSSAPRIKRAFNDSVLQLVPAIAGANLAGFLFKSTGHDLAQFFAQAKATTTIKFATATDVRTVLLNNFPQRRNTFAS